jgi:hypothetical protein
MKANEVYEFTAREMKRDPHLLYYIESERRKILAVATDASRTDLHGFFSSQKTQDHNHGD